MGVHHGMMRRLSRKVALTFGMEFTLGGFLDLGLLYSIRVGDAVELSTLL
jgi:hypothetical protein